MGEATEHEQPGAPRSAEIGARVSAVLGAAEQAAEDMRREAQAEAERIVREAEERGRARVEELTGEPERLVAEAQRHLEDTRALAADERRRFDEEMAARRDEALAHLQAIEEERKKAVAKLQRALGGLRGTASQLEAVVNAMTPLGEEPERRGLGALLGRRGEPNGHGVYEALHERLARDDEPDEQTTEIKEPAKKS